jgi:hypothetical protein
MKFDQATGLWGGAAVAKGVNVPRAASLEKLGSRPASIMDLTSPASRPSTPRMSTR